MAQLRAAALTCFDQVASTLGLDCDALLREAGLDHSVFTQPDRPLRFSTIAALLETAAHRSGCAHFALLMAEARSLGSIGPLSLSLAHQPKVGDVIAEIVRHQGRFGQALQFSREPVGGAVLLRIELAGAPLARQAAELAIAYFCHCISAILRHPWHAESAHFIHHAPSDLSAHRRFFGCPVVFGSEFNGLVCTSESMQEENPGGDRELASHAERLLKEVMPEPAAPSVSERVRRSLRLLLPDHRGSIGEVACNLAVSPRSLQRMLDGEGRRYGALLAEVRRELAMRYLAADQPVGVVASLIGYESASSFTRWFTTEFGKSPVEWRQELERGSSDPHTDQSEFFLNQADPKSKSLPDSGRPASR